MGENIRVVVCDDHNLLRAGIRALLEAEQDIEVVGEAASGEEAVEQVARLSPDVILMDITLPGIDGLEATRRILSTAPSCRVLILTIHKQVHYLLGALKAGASGYVTKSDLDTELIRAVRTTNEGKAFIQSADTMVFFKAYLEQGGGVRGTTQLSDMEERVLKLTAQGQVNREIAQFLNISTSTVNTYRSRVMTKLGLETRSELVQWAIHHGLMYSQ